MGSILDVEVAVTDWSCRCFEGGPFAGRMGVFYSIGDTEQPRTVRAFFNQAENWDWIDKLRNGMYLCVRGDDESSDPMAQSHADGVEALVNYFPSEKVVVDTPGLETPADAVDDSVDHYQVRLTKPRLRDVMDGYDESLQWYAGEARDGRCDFIIECDTWDDYEKVETFSSRYRTPDNRLWLWPEQDFERIEQAAKSAGVNLAVRTDAYRDE